VPVVRISSHQSALRVPRKRIAELIAFVVRRERAAVAEVNVAAVTGRRIAALNRRWLGRRGTTDVMSFDLSGPGEPGVVAEIIVCGDAAAREGRRRGGVQRELLLYVAHGLLHLLGYDDTTPRAAARMHARQKELLEAFLRRQRGGRR